MNKIRELFQRIDNNPQNVKFKDLVKLAQGVGFYISGEQRGSHLFFLHQDPTVDAILNFQRERGKAKLYQVRQLLKHIKTYNLLGD